MKNMIKLIGIIALVAAIGFSMTACQPEEPEPDMIITGITWSSGNNDEYVVVNLWDGTGKWIASGESGNISDGTAKIYIDTDWNGSGSYGIGLNIYSFLSGESSMDYCFTNGKTFSELNITRKDPISDIELRGTLPLYNFTKSTATIEFSKFQCWEN